MTVIPLSRAFLRPSSVLRTRVQVTSLKARMSRVGSILETRSWRSGQRSGRPTPDMVNYQMVKLLPSRSQNQNMIKADTDKTLLSRDRSCRWPVISARVNSQVRFVASLFLAQAMLRLRQKKRHAEYITFITPKMFLRNY